MIETILDDAIEPFFYYISKNVSLDLITGKYSLTVVNFTRDKSIVYSSNSLKDLIVKLFLISNADPDIETFPERIFIASNVKDEYLKVFKQMSDIYKARLN